MVQKSVSNRFNLLKCELCFVWRLNGAQSLLKNVISTEFHESYKTWARNAPKMEHTKGFK